MKSTKDKLSAIDLFSGCGGLSLGLKMAGFDIIGAVEIDINAINTYKLNHNQVHIWNTDIRNITTDCIKKTLNINRGDLDLLAGCPPCQGFSAMRTLNGKKRIQDERNDLIFEFLRFVKDLKPKAIMLENVPGLKTDIRFDIIKESLTLFGYKFESAILNVADYGVPQRRKRFLLLGGLKGVIPFAKPLDKYVTVKEAIFELSYPGCEEDPLHNSNEKRSDRIKKLIKMIPRDGGSRSSLPEEFKLNCHRKCTGFKDVYGRMKWDDVSPTITSGCINPSKGRFLHPELNRTITLREASILQGFPPTYNFSFNAGKYIIASQIGNALPPNFIKLHAEEIVKHLETN